MPFVVDSNPIMRFTLFTAALGFRMLSRIIGQTNSSEGGKALPSYTYPIGFLVCQRQVSAHISVIPFSATQPSSFFAFAASA